MAKTIVHKTTAIVEAKEESEQVVGLVQIKQLSALTKDKKGKYLCCEQDTPLFYSIIKETALHFAQAYPL